MDFLTDVPSHYVDADAPIQGIVIESDNLCHAVVNKDGNPVLDTIEGKPDMPKDAVCMLISAALTSIRDGSGSDGDVAEGYILEPVMPMSQDIQ